MKDRVSIPRSEERLLLEVQLVAYALLGFDKDHTFRCRPTVQEAVEGIIELVREADARISRADGPARQDV